MSKATQWLILIICVWCLGWAATGYVRSSQAANGEYTCCQQHQGLGIEMVRSGNPVWLVDVYRRYGSAWGTLGLGGIGAVIVKTIATIALQYSSTKPHQGFWTDLVGSWDAEQVVFCALTFAVISAIGVFIAEGARRADRRDAEDTLAQEKQKHVLEIEHAETTIAELRAQLDDKYPHLREERQWMQQIIALWTDPNFETEDKTNMLRAYQGRNLIVSFTFDYVWDIPGGWVLRGLIDGGIDIGFSLKALAAHRYLQTEPGTTIEVRGKITNIEPKERLFLMLAHIDHTDCTG